ncbi:hypothetical protein [Pseudonocardia acidicola]|uniref:Septum formation initiator n=1 Tax=Pseudonocardia acidicola TaxID=2724939 RepID=A0ABX1S912_9PSEU|nr:hypothetical protein [Pseudonocardia acidicola]NMH98060.1 hypothetical protein [Pseudonocardia acidicola]
MSPPETGRAARRPHRGRTITLLALWSAAVVGATLVGLTAVGAIGSGIVGAGQQPLSRSEVDARLASVPVPGTVPPVPPATAAPTSAATPAGPGTTGVVTAGSAGTVVARCVNGVAQVITATPAQGYGVHGEQESGDRPRVRFESDGTRVEVRLSCQDGRPVGQLRVDDH